MSKFSKMAALMLYHLIIKDNYINNIYDIQNRIYQTL